MVEHLVGMEFVLLECHVHQVNVQEHQEGLKLGTNVLNILTPRITEGFFIYLCIYYYDINIKKGKQVIQLGLY